MLARAHSFTIEGLHPRHVTIEVDVRPGLPAFTIVGLGDTAVREARERVRTAVLNSGFQFPARRITANLAPADVPKAGPGLDLALACALLAATGQVPSERLESHALLGELALDGTVRGAHATLAVAHAARRAGLDTLALAGAHAREAALVDGLRVAVVERLDSAVRVLAGGAGDPLPPPSPRAAPTAHGDLDEPDLAEVRGQGEAVRALMIAAAGAHNLLLSGPPGSGKTMLARRLPSILPPLAREQAIEVARIASLAAGAPALSTRPPFRAPHHTVTAAGLIGGARKGWVGEAILAHNGVLFLDELSEFARPTLQALRQPLEEGRVLISRAGRSATYPARFILLGAMNPCPCGHAGGGDRCSCSQAEIARQRRRLGGPLLDRIDLLAHLQPPGGSRTAPAPAISSRLAREAVLSARERQRARLRASGPTVNAELGAREVARHARPDPPAQALLERVAASGILSARGQSRLLRVARTIADLDGRERVGSQDIGEALTFRPEST